MRAAMRAEMRATTAMALMRVVRATTTMRKICDVREHGAWWPTRAPGRILRNQAQYHGAFLEVYGACFVCFLIGQDRVPVVISMQK